MTMNGVGDEPDRLKADLARMDEKEEEEQKVPYFWTIQARKRKCVACSKHELKQRMEIILRSTQSRSGEVISIVSSEDGLHTLHIKSAIIIYEVVSSMVPFNCGGYEMTNVKEEPSEESLESSAWSSICTTIDELSVSLGRIFSTQ